MKYFGVWTTIMKYCEGGTFFVKDKLYNKGIFRGSRAMLNICKFVEHLRYY